MNMAPSCPVEFTVSRISGKWRILVLKELSCGPVRYGRLCKALSGISSKVLTQLLRELEGEKLIVREVFPEVPPRVEYSLSEKGTSLFSIFLELRRWGLVSGEEDGVKCAFCEQCRPKLAQTAKVSA